MFRGDAVVINASSSDVLSGLAKTLFSSWIITSARMATFGVQLKKSSKNTSSFSKTKLDHSMKPIPKGGENGHDKGS